MSDILQRIDEENARAYNANIAATKADYDWNRTFNTTPPVDVLRSRLNYADAIDRTINNRLQLAARTDEKALNILQKTAKMDEWNRMAPLREELLKRKVASEGAHERFIQQKDAQSMADVAGFLDTVGKISAPPGTPEYKSQLTAAAVKHPRIIGTQLGADTLKRLSQEHQDIAAITPPPGTEVDQIVIGDDGKAKATFKPVVAPVAIPDGVVPVGATVGTNGKVQVRYGVPKEVKDVVVGSLERERNLHQSAFDRASQRRISAQRAYDKATTDEQRIANRDLILAADADITAAKEGLAGVDQELKAHRNPASGAVNEPGYQEEIQPPPTAPAEAPQLTDKSQFDALPSGAEYIRDGKRYRKP